MTVNEELTELLVGKTLAEAREILPNFVFRTTRQGEQYMLGTADVSLNRINVWTDGEKIVEVRGIG